ncbi:hypothetical protein ACFO4O_08900 [Glaciecola siphonariae]|uniref:Sulfotransferase domain-containing protein n=1 Tax=Glaciecola siphonariae TaxID=521012 RepID=A0ABV9LUS8_9ALTE
MKLGFCASTGRTATTFLAKTLDSLTGITALHEGYDGKTHQKPLLPLINIHNARAWRDASYATELVTTMRDREHFVGLGISSRICLDIAYYNAPLMSSLISRHPDGYFIVMFRRCESFVQSATVTRGEDLTPAGWPGVNKPLSPREQFIAMGRLKPEKGTKDAELWQNWSGICRNIWLWANVNQALINFVNTNKNSIVLFYEDLIERPEHFWKTCLEGLNYFSDGRLQQCLLASNEKVNKRKYYGIDPFAMWGAGEQNFYRTYAKPLEDEIYERRFN